MADKSERIVLWWRQVEKQPGVKYVDMLTWSMEMAKRQEAKKKK